MPAVLLVGHQLAACGELGVGGAGINRSGTAGKRGEHRYDEKDDCFRHLGCLAENTPAPPSRENISVWLTFRSG